jgi:hypothetical protein
MSGSNFTPEIFEQKEITEKECQKLQALLDEQMPNTSFIFAPEDDEIIILDNSVYEKFKRPREEIVINDDDEDDDEDEPEVKPKHDVLFKKDEDDNDDDNDNADDNDEDEDLIHHLSRFTQQLQEVPVTWGDEPQSPWSQHQEQNTLIVPLATESVVTNLYTQQGVGLYFF